MEKVKDNSMSRGRCTIIFAKMYYYPRGDVLLSLERHTIVSGETYYCLRNNVGVECGSRKWRVLNREETKPAKVFSESVLISGIEQVMSLQTKRSRVWQSHCERGDCFARRCSQ